MTSVPLLLVLVAALPARDHGPAATLRERVPGPCGDPICPPGQLLCFAAAGGGPAPPPSSLPPRAVRVDPLPIYVPPVEDVHYPDAEVQERATAVVPALVSASVAGQYAELESSGIRTQVSVGYSAFDFVLLAVFHHGSDDLVVLERTFAQWGFVVLLSAHTGGEVARLRKGTGQPYNLVMPNYQALENTPCYQDYVRNQPEDYIGMRIVAETQGEANFTAAIKYMAPQRDYAAIGSIQPYQKYSVAPDGRIKTADDSIYTTATVANATGPGTLVFDPRVQLPAGHWPATNWTTLKSALVGNVLRVVAVIGFDKNTSKGFEEVAFSPASDPTAAVYVRLLATHGPVDSSAQLHYAYYNVSVNYTARALAPATFYAALLQEQQLWNTTLAPAARYKLPFQEGQRQTDMALGALVLSLSLFIGPQPNYGDGADYWSPQLDRGGSLPFQTIAVNQNLLDLGLISMAADRVGYWFQHYICPNAGCHLGTAKGSINTGNWKAYCPDHFADGLADYGEMADLFAKTARAVLGYTPDTGKDWVTQHIDAAFNMVNYTYALRLNATAREDVGSVSYGLIYGAPEHDTCQVEGFYYHNNVWFVRGLLEFGKFLRDVCPEFCPQYAAYGKIYLDEAARFRADVLASLAKTVVNDQHGQPYFIPPVAQEFFKPFGTMIESVLAEYSNFRYFSELLGADILPLELSTALQNFRESTTGTVSGITRWSDHLDDMPSSYYLVTSLRDNRLQRFFLLQYGHMANYMGRGTWTATEQLPITPDANGYFRDYLWSYLEGGIDECVPSIMLPALATRWQLVLERYDTDVVWLGKGVPRRWARVSGGGFAIEQAATRFGRVSFAVSYAGDNATGGKVVATATVQFRPVSVPGVTQTPQFAVVLRAEVQELVLDADSVDVSNPAVVLQEVQMETGTIVLSPTGTPGQLLEFTVTATFLS
eukprot:m.197901 g.197901  ORF g.197901 m.197901 type:complete len:939 (+) comp21867_c0_seq3:48-2864(+)